jgi:proline dehydrogenase
VIFINEEIQNYMKLYSQDVQLYFNVIREQIIKSAALVIEEKLWARLPSYYVGEKFVRVIPFKDHINIEAAAINKYKHQLESFKITPKGMLQIYLNQNIPCNVLQTIFNETLTR